MYLTFEMNDHSTNNVIYKCYLVDYEKETYDLRFVDEPMLDFDLSKHYCFLRGEEEQVIEWEEKLQYIFFDEEYKRDKGMQL